MRGSSPLRWLLVAALLAVYCAAGFSRISFDVEILKLLPTHLRQVQGLSLFLEHFSQPDEVMLTIEAADAETADKAATDLAAHLRAQPALVRRAVERAPWEDSPQQLSEFLAFALLNQPPEKIREMKARLAPDAVETTLSDSIEKLGASIAPLEVAMLSYDPLGLTSPLEFDRLIPSGAQSEFSSADGTFRVIYVQSARVFHNYRDNIAWLRELKQTCATWNTGRNITLGFTGEPAFVADIAGSMHHDMATSGGVTLALIAAIFWFCFRRAHPLFALQGMLVLIFLLSLATAGLFLDELTVIGVGFASIMIGLSVDYGYFVYQASRQHNGTTRELQWRCLQNVMWTAGTTAAAFIALNVSSLPGISQLGTLVGIGVIVGAAVMLALFAPISLRLKAPAAESAIERFFASPPKTAMGGWVTLALVLGLTATLAVKGFPRFDFSAESLRPRVSGAYDAMDRVYTHLANDRNLLSLIVTGKSEDEVFVRLQAAEARLGGARSFTSPLAIWPHTAHQRENLATVLPLAAELPRLRQAVSAAGFKDEAFGLAEAVIHQWSAWQNAHLPVWPQNDASRWILRRIARQADGQFFALGIAHPKSGEESALVAAVEGEGTYLVSWSQLGRELARVIPGEFQRVIAGLVGIVLVLLAMALRSVRAVLVFSAATALTLAALLGAMSLFGLKWNLFNLAAILLLLGTGIDYSILMLLALRRNGGDVTGAHRSLGLVIFLCATSSIAGFGTIGWANHIGLASLGITCALGLTFAALIALFLLPYAWRWGAKHEQVAVKGSAAPQRSDL